MVQKKKKSMGPGEVKKHPSGQWYLNYLSQSKAQVIRQTAFQWMIHVACVPIFALPRFQFD